MSRVFFLLAVSFTMIFAGCRKESAEQGISLKTRKAKLCERWIMVSGNVGLQIHSNNAPPEIVSFQLNGTGGVVTNGYNLSYYNIKYTLAIEFDKKGRFWVTENLDGQPFNSSGRWDFGHGVGDRKKKEDIFIQLDDVNTGYSGDHFFNHFSPEFNYEIERLTKDELKVHSYTNYFMDANGEKGTIESNYVFRKQ